MIYIYDAFSSFTAFNHFPNFFFKYILVVLKLVRSESVCCIVLTRARSGGQCGQVGKVAGEGICLRVCKITENIRAECELGLFCLGDWLRFPDPQG